MEIVSARAAELTNYEALRFLKEVKAAQGVKLAKGKQGGNKRLLTVALEAIGLLEGGPAGRQEEHMVRELAEQLGELCREEGIRFSKEELVQLANHRWPVVTMVW